MGGEVMANDEDPFQQLGKDIGCGPLLTIPEVAQKLRLKESTVRKMIFERRIDTVRPSQRSVRIPEIAVKQILEQGFRKAIPLSRALKCPA